MLQRPFRYVFGGVSLPSTAYERERHLPPQRTTIRPVTSFNSLQAWSQSLGLLPFPLRPDDASALKAVLLNGDRGNFCLDLSGAEPDGNTRNDSWSCNVGHYISINGETALVQRWDRSPAALELFKLRRIAEDPEHFHEHLISTSPPRSASVVAHALRTFRQLRAVLGSDVEGNMALEVFLVLLACAAERRDDPSPQLDRWGLTEGALVAARLIDADDWSLLLSQLTEERSADRLQPAVDLVLRHAAGALFQEAHYLASFPWGGQMLLHGLPHPEVTIARDSKEKGVHFTPAPLARALVQATISQLSLKAFDRLVVLDPACGSGEFLREAARQLRSMGYRGKIQLRGADQSPGACAMARFLLSWEHHAAVDTEFAIRCGDSLTDADCWPDEADLVLMNPPFISWLGMSATQQEAVRAILGDLAGARPDMASAFLWKATQIVSGGGALGSVIPASTLDGNSYENLRHRIEREYSLRLLARLGSHQIFPNAKVDAGLIVVSRDPRPSEPRALWADHRPESASRALRTLRRMGFAGPWSHAPVEADGYSIYSLTQVAGDMGNWAPRPYRQWRLRHLLSSCPAVKDVFTVRQGVHTGRNDVFLLPAAEFYRLPEAERPYFRPAIINDSIVAGTLRSATFLFYPYGESAIRDEEELLRRVPTYYEGHLKSNRHELAARQRKSLDDWWTLAEYRAWQVPIRPKLVSAYFGDVGSFAFDEDGDHVVVQGYAWLPRQRMSRTVALAYLAVVNSAVFGDLLAASSNNIGSGAWNLSKRYVSGIPIPRIADVPRDVIDGLAGLGQQIAADGLSSFGRDQSRDLLDFSQAAYGLGGLFEREEDGRRGDD